MQAPEATMRRRDLPLRPCWLIAHAGSLWVDEAHACRDFALHYRAGLARRRGAMGQIFSRMQWRIAIPYTLLIGACLFGLSAYLAAILSQVQVDGMRTRLSAEAR